MINYRYFIKEKQQLVNLVFLIGLIVLGIYFLQQFLDINFLKQSLRHIFTKISFDILLNPFFYLIVFSIFYLELLIPANKKQKPFSIGVKQDFIWLLSDIIFKIIILSPYILLLQSFSNNYLEFLHLPLLDNSSVEIKFIVGVLFSDFLLWLSHLVRHKVPLFWYFHAVHHSQTELNLFSDLRFHVVDSLITLTIAIIPLALLEIPLPAVAIYLAVQRWYLRIYHANLKTNYGWLKYILVTPQSHRIHHSIEEKHQDKNFATVFSLWDYLFQTQYKNYDEYPATGISDRNFPLENSKHWHKLLKNYFLQLLYPFTVIIKEIKQ